MPTTTATLTLRGEDREVTFTKYLDGTAGIRVRTKTKNIGFTLDHGQQEEIAKFFEEYSE